MRGGGKYGIIRDSIPKLLVWTSVRLTSGSARNRWSGGRVLPAFDALRKPDRLTPNSIGKCPVRATVEPPSILREQWSTFC